MPSSQTLQVKAQIKKKKKITARNDLLAQLNICDNKCNKTQANKYATEITTEMYGF